MKLPLPRDAFPRRLRTARLCLRKPEDGESALYARIAEEAYTTRPQPLSPDQARAFADFMIGHWDRYGFGFLVIDVTGSSGTPVTVGHAGFRYVDAWPDHWAESYDAIELGYSVVPDARGHGYVTEAARALLATAFAVFDVPSIRANCRHDNPKSAAVLLRCGMTELEPTERGRRFEVVRGLLKA